MPLSDNDRSRLDYIVSQMQANGESDDYIQNVVNDFKGKYGGIITSSTPPMPVTAPPAPTFTSELGSQLSGAVSGLYNTFRHPIQTAQGLWTQEKQYGQEAYDALMGRGTWSGAPLAQRLSDASDAAFATIPVIGPLALQASQNLNAGNRGAGLADTLALAALTKGPQIARSVAGGAVDTAQAVGRAVYPEAALARAGAQLGDIATTLGDRIVDVSDPGEVALKSYARSSAGGSVASGSRVKVIADFLKEASDPNAQPMTYAKDKAYYDNTFLSPRAFDNLSRTTQRELIQFRGALKDAMGDVADAHGLGDVNSIAQAEYSNALKWRDLRNKTARVATKLGVGAGLAGAGLSGLNQVIRVWNQE